MTACEYQICTQQLHNGISKMLEEINSLNDLKFIYSLIGEICNDFNLDQAVKECPAADQLPEFWGGIK